MDGTDSPTLLERKIGAHAPRPVPVSGPEHLLFAALAREGERRLSLPLGARALACGRRTAAEILETLPDLALIALLDGPGGATGLAVLDPGCLSALIEAMTLGDVSAGPPAARRPTRTDAAMVSGLIDGMLAAFDPQVAADPAAVWAHGFRYGSHLADPRPLAVLLDEPDYRVLRLDLALGAVGREGSLSLVLPARGRGRVATPPAAPTAEPPAPSVDAAFALALRQAVCAVQAEVGATLARVTLPLADFLALEAGQSLTLPSDALLSVQVEGADGRLLCLARLGQGGGQRALRLCLPEGGAESPPIAPPTTPAEVIAAAAQPLHRAPAASERAATPASQVPHATEVIAGPVADPQVEGGAPLVGSA